MATIEDLRCFYSINRQIFTRLINLGRDPIQSMKVVALWQWMEIMGLPNFITELITSKDSVVNYAVEEAVSCIEYMEESYRTRYDPLPVTSKLLGRAISFEFFDEYREEALDSIWKTVNYVFSFVFEDIVQCPSMRRATGITFGVNIPQAMQYDPRDDRTIFVTFSNGYPISKEELRIFFEREYGNCIEDIQMQEVRAPHHPLFAHVIFQSASMVPLILGEQTKVKVVINKKFVCMRKFISRHHRI